MDQTHHALRIAATVACAATLSLAACSDTAITPPTRSASPDSPSLTRDPDIMLNGPRVFHTKPWHDNDNASHGRGGGGGGSNNGISYHGGPVLQSGTNVVAVYWASLPIYVNGPTPGTSRRQRRRPVARRPISAQPWRFAVLQHQLVVHRWFRSRDREQRVVHGLLGEQHERSRERPERERRVRCCRCCRADSCPARSRTTHTRSTRSSPRAR